MPAGGGVISQLNGQKFFKGYIFMTRAASGEPVDGIRVGGVQNVNINHEFGKAMSRGPESLSPLGVGITEENLTATAAALVVLPSYFKALMGCTISTDGSGNTVVTKRVNDEPVPFDVHLKTPADGSDLEIKMYRCLANTSNVFKADNRGWSTTDFGWQAFGKPVDTGDNMLWQAIYPGNQTDSSTGFGTPLALS